MADAIFEHPRMVEIYDSFDGERNDLVHYLAIAKELKAKSVLDVGCGTGCFAQLLNNHGFEVTGVEPAEASLNKARQKPNMDGIRWILGDATSLPALKVDLAVMTGNVAQVFLTDEAWSETLLGIRQALNLNGHLVFEVRDPSQKGWLKWTRDQTYSRVHIENVGFVKGWCDITDVSDELVSFRWTYVFESDGEVICSDSTIRFRERDAIVDSLNRAGYKVQDIRDAPDRPKLEFVFIAALS